MPGLYALGRGAAGTDAWHSVVAEERGLVDQWLRGRIGEPDPTVALTADDLVTLSDWGEPEGPALAVVWAAALLPGAPRR